MAQREESFRWRRDPRGPARNVPAWGWMLVGAAGVVIIGLGDLASGREVSFSLFYVIPIVLAAWMLGRWAAIVLSVAAAGTWLAADRMAGTEYSAAWIGIWNSAVRLGFFLIIGLLVDSVRRMLALQRGLARTDGLTGVLNVRAFVAEVEREIIRARRYGHATGLIYVDLDDFKAINDRHGHKAGDDILCRVAGMLRSFTRSIDVIGRLGGDEFAILLPETDQPGAAAVAGKLLAQVGTDLVVAISIGVVTCDTPVPTAEDLIRAADEAMYAAKRSGKNRIEHHHVEGAEEPASS
jgi:diguanylate cyclase (GGDEF)-like protein